MDKNMYELKFDVDRLKSLTQQSKLVITQNDNEYLKIDSKTNYFLEFLSPVITGLIIALVALWFERRFSTKDKKREFERLREQERKTLIKDLAAEYAIALTNLNTIYLLWNLTKSSAGSDKKLFMNLQKHDQSILAVVDLHFKESNKAIFNHAYCLEMWSQLIQGEIVADFCGNGYSKGSLEKALVMCGKIIKNIVTANKNSGGPDYFQFLNEIDSYQEFLKINN
jgi:hypothetical protein